MLVHERTHKQGQQMTGKIIELWQHWQTHNNPQNLKKFPLHHSNLSCIPLLLCLSVLPGSLTWAEPGPRTTRPLYSFNQSPLIQIYGLPALGDSLVLAPDQQEVTLRFQVANNFASHSDGTERVYLDGETHRLTLAWTQGLAGGIEWGFELPYLTHGGGFLDNTIERWHDALGLPQGGRTDVSRNLIEFRYTRNGMDLINVDRPVSGWGDIRLLAAKQIELNEEFGLKSLALRASLKLPTGQSSELRGSGSTDLALWVSAETTFLQEDWSLYGGGGILLMSEGKVLPQQQRQAVSFGTLGMSKKFGSFAVIGQLDAHSPFYQATLLRPLGKYSVQGLLGVIWEVVPRRFLEFSASEDLVANTSPDVAFNLSLTMPF